MTFLQKIEAEKKALVENALDVGFQKACDFISMALNSPEVMGKGVMSGERIDKIISYAIEKVNEYHEAYSPSKYVEADVWQARLDEHQKRIFKDKFVPFAKRYPSIRRNKY
jgi:hypothetical protein